MWFQRPLERCYTLYTVYKGGGSISKTFALIGHPLCSEGAVKAEWAEDPGQTVLGDLATILDYDSVWHRDNLVQYIAKSVGV